MAYLITEECSGCGVCVEACPRDCIDDASVPVTIDPEKCVDCGVCELECPLGAAVAPGR